MEQHVTSTIRLHGVHTNSYTVSVQNPYKITHAMTKYFDQRMHSAGHHDPKHLINGDKTLATLLLVFLITLTTNYFICSCPIFFPFPSFWLPSCMIFCVCSYTNMCKMFRRESPAFNSVKTRWCLWVVFEQPCSLYVEMWQCSALQRVISHGHY